MRRRRGYASLALCFCSACSRHSLPDDGAKANAQTSATAQVSAPPPLLDAGRTKPNPCTKESDAEVERGAVASIAGLLVIEARDGRSPSHGMGNVTTARFRLGNLSDRSLRVEVTGLQWRSLTDPARHESFAIKRITATSGATVSALTITVEPGNCAAVEVVAGGAPQVGYHVRAAYEATFSVEGSSVVARSDDMYFRYPHNPSQ